MRREINSEITSQLMSISHGYMSELDALVLKKLLRSAMEITLEAYSEMDGQA